MEDDKNYRKNILKHVKRVKEYRFTILNRVARVGFKVKVIFEQRLDGIERIGFIDLKEKFFSRDE